MLAMLFNCCTCHYQNEDLDDFREVEGCLYCVDCYDDEEIVYKCEECHYRSGNAYYYKLVATSPYTDKTVCIDCLEKSNCSTGW